MTNVSNQIVAPGTLISGVLMSLRNGRFAEASAHFAKEFRFADHGIGLEFTDQGRLAEFFAKNLEFYPDSSVTVNRAYTSDDYVILDWTYRATTTEPFYGGQSTNFPVAVQGASIVRTRDGEIVEWSDYYDGLKSRRTALAAHFQEWFEL